MHAKNEVRKHQICWFRIHNHASTNKFRCVFTCYKNVTTVDRLASYDHVAILHCFVFVCEKST